jgi:Protein of unknown function (DUF1761)
MRNSEDAVRRLTHRGRDELFALHESGGGPPDVSIDRTSSKEDQVMIRINYFAIGVAVIAVFIASLIWYSPLAFGKEFMELSGVGRSSSPNIGMIAGELARTLILAYVLARLVLLLNVVDWKGAVRLGLWLWVGFPIVLLSGSVMWQNVPWKLAAIHAGDWLVKILLIAVILGIWSKGGRASAPAQTPSVR